MNASKHKQRNIRTAPLEAVTKTAFWVFKLTSSVSIRGVWVPTAFCPGWFIIL